MDNSNNIMMIPFALTKENVIRKIKTVMANNQFVSGNSFDISEDCVKKVYVPFFRISGHVKALVSSSINRRPLAGGIPRIINENINDAVSLLVSATSQMNCDIQSCFKDFSFGDMQEFTGEYLEDVMYLPDDLSEEKMSDNVSESLDASIKLLLLRKYSNFAEFKDVERYYGLFASAAFDFKIKEKIIETEYAQKVYCPVYFVSFEYQGKQTCMMVNGSYGNVIGYMPLDYGKVKNSQIASGILQMLASAFIGFFASLIPIVGPVAVLLIYLNEVAAWKKEKEKYEIDKNVLNRYIYNIFNGGQL